MNLDYCPQMALMIDSALSRFEHEDRRRSICDIRAICGHPLCRQLLGPMCALGPMAGGRDAVMP